MEQSPHRTASAIYNNVSKCSRVSLRLQSPHPSPRLLGRPRSPTLFGLLWWFSMSRRAVVFGAAGQLGNELVRELRRRRFTVMAWDRSQVDIDRKSTRLNSSH